jgi:hypothetical protein
MRVQDEKERRSRAAKGRRREPLRAASSPHRDFKMEMVGRQSGRPGCTSDSGLTATTGAFVGPAVDAPVFTGRTGQPLRPRGIEDAWRAAREEVGLPSMRFHDLRHFAGTMAAAAGASTKEVMARGGWSSPQMALRYEHATQERDRFIAHALESFAGPGDADANAPLTAVSDREDRARSRTQRARRSSGVECEREEMASDLGNPATRVRPSGFEPETCGLRVRCSAVELEAHPRV